MKPRAISRRAAPADLIGRVLCHDVRDAERKVAAHKGDIIDEPTAEALLRLPGDEIHVLEMEPGDVHEEQAGKRLAAAVVGEGVEVKGYAGGQWSLAATRRGLLRVRCEPLRRANSLEGIAVFTLFDGLTVEPGEIVAKCKVTPLVVAGATIAAIERLASEAGGMLVVREFRPLTVGAIARESLDDRQRARFEKSLAEKIGWFGARLLPVRYAGGGASEVAREMTALRAAGAEVLIVAGASALDPLDPVFGALALVGARMERHGAPAHPGSLLWVADWSARPVVGMPTCGMFSEATTFDLVVPRLLAGERVGNAEIAELGHGGLLSRDSAYRFPPYRTNTTRGQLE